METCAPGTAGPGCSEHPQSPAVARCVGCGRFTCALCRVHIGNRNFCRACAAAQAAPSPPQPPVPAQPYQVQPQYYQQYPPNYQQYPPYYVPVPYPYRTPGRPLREPVFPGAPWGVGEGLIIFFIALAVSVGLSLFIDQVLLTVASANTSRILLTFISSLILYALLLGGTFYSVDIRHHSNLAAIGLKKEGAGRGVALGFGLGLPLFVVALGFAFVSNFLYNAFYKAIYNRPTPNQFMPQVNGPGASGWLLVILIFTLVVLAPVCEEIFFRGYMYPALRNRMSMQPAMIINGLIFAAVHFELIGFLPRFVLGYGLCYMFERNRTLAPSIVGHALYNGLLIVLSSVFGIF